MEKEERKEGIKEGKDKKAYKELVKNITTGLKVEKKPEEGISELKEQKQKEEEPKEEKKPITEETKEETTSAKKKKKGKKKRKTRQT